MSLPDFSETLKNDRASNKRRLPEIIGNQHGIAGSRCPAKQNRRNFWYPALGKMMHGRFLEDDFKAFALGRQC